MRTVSDAARAQLFAQQGGYSVPLLLEITHGVEGYDNPLRIVNNTENLTYDSDVYTAFPFRFDPPDHREDGTIGNARITICTVDQQIAAILRSASSSTPPTVAAIAAFYYDTGAVTFEPFASWSFTLRKVSGDASTVTAELVYEEALDNEVPAHEFRPEDFLGVS